MLLSLPTLPARREHLSFFVNRWRLAGLRIDEPVGDVDVIAANRLIGQAMHQRVQPLRHGLLHVILAPGRVGDPAETPRD